MTVLEILRGLPRVPRAWPADGGGLVFEQVDNQGRVRAGYVSADGQVALAPFGLDPKLPSLTPQPGLVVHRLHRRAVVIDPQRGVAVKHLRPGKTAAIATTSRDIAGAAVGTGLTVPQVTVETKTSLEFALVPGQTLMDLGDHGLAGWEEFLARWPKLVAAGSRLPLLGHSRGDEVAVLQRWLRQVTDYQAIGELLPELTAAVDVTCNQLMAGRADPTVLLHRDLHDKQILWDKHQGSLSVLDLDTSALGEAALDCGNLLAHVELRGFQGVYSAQVRGTLAQAITAMAEQLSVSEERLKVYTQAARLRLACVYAFRPTAQGWLADWVEHALTH